MGDMTLEQRAREIANSPHIKIEYYGAGESLQTLADNALRAVRADALEEAAKYHDNLARIFRDAIANRISHRVPFGEHQLQAEWHEEHAAAIRKLKEKG